MRNRVVGFLKVVDEMLPSRIARHPLVVFVRRYLQCTIVGSNAKNDVSLLKLLLGMTVGFLTYAIETIRRYLR